LQSDGTARDTKQTLVREADLVQAIDRLFDDYRDLAWAGSLACNDLTNTDTELLLTRTYCALHTQRERVGLSEIE